MPINLSTKGIKCWYVQQTYHGRSSHEQRAAVTELSKLLPVVFAAVQLAVPLIVPVSQVVAAHGTPENTKTLGHVCTE